MNRYFEILTLIATSLVLWWPPLCTNLRLAWSSDAHTYVLLIVPLSLVLIQMGRTPSISAMAPNRVAGATLLGTALLARFLASLNVFHLSLSSNLSVNIGALILFWIGSVIFCFGVHTFRSHMFALCFLFLFIPLPDYALAWVTGFLQQKSAWATALMFRLAGVPVARDGVMLYIAGLNIEVAKECSSIRSSTMLMVITLILAQLSLRMWSRKALVLLAAIPLSIAKNAVRIFTIAELGTRVDRGFLHGRLHHHGGVIFLGLAVVGVVALLWLLRKSETQTAELAPHDA